GCFEFRHGHGVRVRLEDPGDLADELYEGLVPRTLLVRQLSNVEGLTAVGLHIERELFGEPRLADARLTEDRDEVRSSLRDRAVPDVSNEPGLTVTSDERHLRRPDREGYERFDRHPRRDRLPLPLGGNRRDRLAPDHPAGGPEGLLADQDPTGWRGALEPRGGVHHITGHQEVPIGRAGFDRHHRLASVAAQLDL